MTDAEWVAAKVAQITSRHRYVKLRRPLPVVRPPCAHEEAVLEWCKTCHGPKAEGRHVRGCAIHDRCTRDKNSGILKSCDGCDEYSQGGAIDAAPHTEGQS